MISSRTKGKDGGITKIRDLLPIIGVFLVPLALIIIQPDFGTAMVYVFTFFSMLFLARTSLKLIFAWWRAWALCYRRPGYHGGLAEEPYFIHSLASRRKA